MATHAILNQCHHKPVFLALTGSILERAKSLCKDEGLWQEHGEWMCVCPLPPLCSLITGDMIQSRIKGKVQEAMTPEPEHGTPGTSTKE